GAGLPTLDARTVCALFGGINAAAKFKVGESAPVRFLKRSAAVKKLFGRKGIAGAHQRAPFNLAISAPRSQRALLSLMS
ncbi:hypothetical protein, partial [Xanthomonas translucens]